MLKRKRSRHVALVLAGTATLALAACEDDRVDAQSFPDLQSCIAAAEENSLFFTAEDCRTNFAAAQEEYLETAPRYESKELCEQQHGAGDQQFAEDHPHEETSEDEGAEAGEEKDEDQSRANDLYWRMAGWN